MAQLIVTLDSTSSITPVKEAIGLLKGVRNVTVVKANKKASVTTEELADVSEDIRSLIGLASGIPSDEIEADARLSYLMRK